MRGCGAAARRVGGAAGGVLLPTARGGHGGGTHRAAQAGSSTTAHALGRPYRARLTLRRARGVAFALGTGHKDQIRHRRRWPCLIAPQRTRASTHPPRSHRPLSLHLRRHAARLPSPMPMPVRSAALPGVGARACDSRCVACAWALGLGRAAPAGRGALVVGGGPAWAFRAPGGRAHGPGCASRLPCHPAALICAPA